MGELVFNLDGDEEIPFVDDGPQHKKPPSNREVHYKSKRHPKKPPVEIPVGREAERERAKRDKLYLATEVLGYDFQPDVHLELFAQYIQFQAETPYFRQSPIKDRLILWPRGHYKTTSITVEIIQTILNNPNIRILLMQGTVENTKEWLAEIKAHFFGEVQNSRLAELFPEFCVREGDPRRSRGSAEYWTTPARTRRELRQATITVASMKSVKAGKHFDVGFFDDLVNDQNYLSPDLMERVAKQFRLMIPLIEPAGYRYVTGTRYVFGDLYEQIIRQNEKTHKWVISVKNCWTDDGKEVRFPERQLSDGRIIGFTRESLEDKQREDPYMFACHYMNKPVHGSTQLFNELLVNSCLLSAKASSTLGFHKALGRPEILPVTQEEIYKLLGPSYLFIDLAASKKRRSDHSVIMCGKADNFGRVYLVDAIGDKWDPDQLAMYVIAMALKHHPQKILIEGTAAGKYAMSYIAQMGRLKGVNLPLDLIPVSNQNDAKNLRIGAIAGAMRKEQIVFFNGLPRWNEIFEQFVNFDPRKASHDDYPDTIGLMLEHFRGKRFQAQPKQTHPLIAMIVQSQNPNITSAIFPAVPSNSEGLGADFAC